MSGPAGTAAKAGRTMREVAVALRQELAELHLITERGPQCAMTAAAVALATTVALAVRVDSVWWAAISAFVSTQATGPASLRRGGLRIAGTAAGATLALLLSPWLVDDEIALSLVLLVVSTWGVIGFLVSRHGYAWLLGAVTAIMVLLAALGDPLSALSVACNRTAEVTIGTVAAILVALILAPKPEAAPPAVAPGWSDLQGTQWPAVQHALRAGISVMLVPLVWTWAELPGVAQTAVTVAAVMAVPALSNDAAIDQQKIAERAMHRVLGCLFGGTVGLACLALSVDSFLPWLLMLTAGVWVAAHVQGSQRGIGYIGTQAAVVFITTLVQGWGPPSSILPGVERLAGITGGLAILLVVTLLTAPSRPSAVST
ncbi:MAG TPA: FUSC family protein [Acetobacteraceae bacterium]|nr:FUSC family protein [Acetobacteraceae bacterium]